jgi:Tubulin domain
MPRNGPTVVQRQAAIERNSYQQSLEEGSIPPELTTESVRYWSDFNRVYFHPRSIVQLNEYELGSSLMPFEKWNMGEELFGSLDKEHDVLDRDFRPFAEEADQMQAIQLMTSSDDAWGGFASRYMDRLRDEYGKTTVWVWGVEDGIKSTPRVSDEI